MAQETNLATTSMYLHKYLRRRTKTSVKTVHPSSSKSREDTSPAKKRENPTSCTSYQRQAQSPNGHTQKFEIITGNYYSNSLATTDETRWDIMPACL
jgi:hypothetical protein